MLKFIISGEDFKSGNINLGLAIVRIFSGLGIALSHGIHKIPVSDGFINSVGELGFPFPSFFAWMAGISEFFGGLLVAFGLFTRPSSVLLLFTMAVAAFIGHADDPFSGKEKALIYMVIFIFFAMTGSGKFGVDHVIRKRFSK